MDSVKYKSAWDWFSYSVVAVLALVCFGRALFESTLVGWLLSFALFFIVIISFCGTYYKIVGEWLVIYTCFVPNKFPIDKIASIKPTKSLLSAPAISLSDRIAISFTDRSVTKGTMPLIVSPKDRHLFIRHLLSINPKIKVE